jgi:hypothetical protein
MSTPQNTSDPDRGEALPRSLRRRLLDSYLDWRQEAASVAQAYSRWVAAQGAEGGPRFSAYVAALDREEAAATAYAGVLTDGERWLRRANALRARPRRRDALGGLLARQGLPAPGT